MDAAEQTWIQEQRRAVTQYLQREGVTHGAIGEGPAWHLHPCVAVWAIESLSTPGRVGFWAISGDCPTDHMSGSDAENPREVLRHFSGEWSRTATNMLTDKEDPDLVIGAPEDRPELGDLLRSRAEVLHKWAEDPELWVEEATDWRLQGQEQYLQGQHLVWRAYRRYASNPDWDHDHCAFCWAKFMVEDHPDVLHEGYATLDDYHWICATCFADFRERFEWVVSPDDGPP